MKQTFKTKNWYKYLSIIIFVLLVISFVFNIVFVKKVNDNMVYNREIGEDYTLNLNNTTVKVVSFFVDGTTLLNQTIKQTFKIKVGKNLLNKTLKISAVLEDNYVDLKTDMLWQKDENLEEYTYIGNIDINKEIIAFSEVFLNNNLKLNKNYVYTLNVVVRCLD